MCTTHHIEDINFLILYLAQVISTRFFRGIYLVFKFADFFFEFVFFLFSSEIETYMPWKRINYALAFKQYTIGILFDGHLNVLKFFYNIVDPTTVTIWSKESLHPKWSSERDKYKWMIHKTTSIWTKISWFCDEKPSYQWLFPTDRQVILESSNIILES